jgi:hypothetical protein
MKVSGVSFGKNVIKYDYPIVEAIQSIIPICDEVIVAEGESEDDSLSLLNSISPDKVKIIETQWDETLREGGRVLAEETNKALKAVANDSDWIFYIQGDEVLHEDFLPLIKMAMLQYKEDDTVDGLLFNYRHFYGSYSYIANSYDWYRREIRVIKNNRNIYSYRDAQGFRKNDNEKLNVKLIDAFIYHYGWVKDPITQQEKQKSFHQLWHSGEDLEKKVDKSIVFFDYSGIDSLRSFEGSHPKVMSNRVSNQNWDFHFDKSSIKLSLKNKIKRFIEKLTGVQLGEYQNYRKIN